MANQKRAPSTKRGAEPSFNDEEILRADDPRPQRVTQYPSTGARRAVRKSDQEAIPTSVFDTEKHDEELKATYGHDSNLGYKPVFIYVERGPGAGQLVQVKQGHVVVGRASVSDLRLQHPSISRRHSQITRIGEQFYVKDLGSQNGTFVNKTRIATEVEVFPGDSIAMGNALMKLRGPLAKGEQLPTDKRAKAPKTAMKTGIVSTRPKSSNAVKIAIFAGAVGFGLAAVLAIALIKLPGSGQPTARALNTRGANAKAADEVVVAIESSEIKAKIDDAIAKKMAERKVAVPIAAPPASGDETRVASAHQAAKNDDDFGDEAPATSPKKTGSGGGNSRTAILAPFEKGDAESSLELAKKGGDKDLSDKLNKFIGAYDNANDAMVANNGTLAIKNFESALKLDEQLSSGWSKYGTEIRQKLSKLYVLVGNAHLKNDDEAAAKTAFTAALKNDPANASAKSALAKLGGGSDEVAAAPAKKKAAAAADDEFADDEAPKKPAKKAAAPAKKVEPKSKAQAIDDAFGD